MNKNTLEKHFLINGVPVQRHDSPNFLGYDLYTPVKEDEDYGMVIYFVKGTEVKGKVRADACEGQGIGYVSGMEFSLL